MDKYERLHNIEAIALDWCRGKMTIQEARKNWVMQLEPTEE